MNDFLSPEKRKTAFTHPFAPSSSVKDIIESLGVPHTEVDLILVNGQSVTFSYQVREGDVVSVYPVFESLDISPVTRLRPKPLRRVRFILDVHLGKLARHLRLLGFDTFYDTSYSDRTIIDIAQKEKRIILTRDIGLLKNKKVTHGYWLRQTNPKNQVREILDRFDLKRQCQPFTRCLECNGKIVAISQRSPAMKKVPKRVKENQQDFYRCKECKRVYWEGTHYEKLLKFIEELYQSKQNT